MEKILLWVVLAADSIVNFSLDHPVYAWTLLLIITFSIISQGEVSDIETESNKITRIVLKNGEAINADMFLVAAGLDTFIMCQFLLGVPTINPQKYKQRADIWLIYCYISSYQDIS